MAASKFVSWNTHGLNHPVKCGKVFSHLKKSKADVVYLQKTHLRMTDHSRIKQGGFSQIFHSKCHAKCHGSAILIYRDVQFVESKEISDKNGCFVIVPGKLFNIPNNDDQSFFEKIYKNLSTLQATLDSIIMVGDFNTSRQIQTNVILKSGAGINSFRESYNLSDPWRKIHHSYSRIKIFLLENRILPFVTNSQYHTIIISGHSPVQLGICFLDSTVSQRALRLDPLQLSCSAHHGVFLQINCTPDVSHSTVWKSLKAYPRGQLFQLL
uniref:Endonuclease/exonuclease/phosphatase domain-containing protein n=1 Tax=Oncorhynchus mykiss TaxID=8022 RepID=A0A8K9X327_ONCMY